MQDLERGVSRLPRQETVDLLAAALGLAAEDHAALVAAARPAPAVPAPVALSPAPLGAPMDAAAQPTGTLLPLVGRGRELAALERFLAGEDAGGPLALLAGAEPTVLLAGEPGIGKTRLLQVAAGRRRGAGACWRAATTAEQPYAPLPLPDRPLYRFASVPPEHGYAPMRKMREACDRRLAGRVQPGAGVALRDRGPGVDVPVAGASRADSRHAPGCRYDALAGANELAMASTSLSEPALRLAV